MVDYYVSQFPTCCTKETKLVTLCVKLSTLIEVTCHTSRMLFDSDIIWPDVDFSRADWPPHDEPVNFLCSDFHVKGEICCLAGDPDLSPSDPPRVDQQKSNAFPVVYVAESKFEALRQSKGEVSSLDSIFCKPAYFVLNLGCIAWIPSFLNLGCIASFLVLGFRPPTSQSSSE